VIAVGISCTQQARLLLASLHGHRRAGRRHCPSTRPWREALFVLAGGVGLLIFIGIRNAWDTVTYIAIGGVDEPPTSG
jgi:hypothetical protein